MLRITVDIAIFTLKNDEVSEEAYRAVCILNSIIKIDLIFATS